MTTRFNRSSLIALGIAAVAVMDAAVVIAAADYRPATWQRAPRFISVASLQKSPDAFRGVADAVTVDGRPYPLTATGAAIPRASEATLVGWAVDQTQQKAFGSALLSWDGAPFVVVPYGASRPDVAAALGCPACEASGYRITFDGRELRPGAHTVRLRFVTANMTGFVDAPPVAVRVR